VLVRDDPSVREGQRPVNRRVTRVGLQQVRRRGRHRQRQQLGTLLLLVVVVMLVGDDVVVVVHVVRGDERDVANVMLRRGEGPWVVGHEQRRRRSRVIQLVVVVEAAVHRRACTRVTRQTRDPTKLEVPPKKVVWSGKMPAWILAVCCRNDEDGLFQRERETGGRARWFP
jgi:hypothetical protein